VNLNYTAKDCICKSFFPEIPLITLLEIKESSVAIILQAA